MAEKEERLATPEHREKARMVVFAAQGRAEVAWWSWYDAHVACVDYFGDRPANPADVSP